jgi:hypothetical protein
LGVLLKKIMQSGEQHSKPCYFMTSIACHVLDKVSVFFPQFDKVLIPIKHIINQSIFCNYDLTKYTKLDELELTQLSSEPDLTKKDPKIKVKYLEYETYHDKLS